MNDVILVQTNLLTNTNHFESYDASKIETEITDITTHICPASN